MFLNQAKDGKAKRPDRQFSPLGNQVESLEARMLLAGNVISGYVYHDVNSSGKLDQGDQPIADNTIQLMNSSNVVVGTTKTNAAGKYEFSGDSTASTAPTSKTETVSVPATATNFSKEVTVPQFDSALGTLTSVDITFNGTLTSQLKVESRDQTPTTINGQVSGTLNVEGPGVAELKITPNSALSFPASAYDGVLDYGGTSGKDFGAVPADGTKTVTLTTDSDLAAYTGTGTVPFTISATSSSNASGPGNLSSEISSTGEGSINVIYHYTPVTSLQPGRYSIVQTTQPEGFLQGTNTRAGVAVPRTNGQDVIPVTLANADLTDNNFGETQPNGLAGSVFLDANRNGTRDPKEFGIATVKISLRGRDNTNTPVILTTETNAEGQYQFDNLRPGTYSLAESQPNVFRTGGESTGSLGGQTSRNRITQINLTAGQVGTDYNFSETTRPDCTLKNVFYRVDRDLPLRNAPGPVLQRYLPGLVSYNTQHPRRR